MDLPQAVAFLFEQDAVMGIPLDSGLVLQLTPGADPAFYLLRLCRRAPQQPSFTDVVQVRRAIATLFAHARRPQIIEQSRQHNGEWAWIPLSIRFPALTNRLRQPFHSQRH